MTAMNFDSLTIVAIYGNNDGYDAIPAIRKSLAELPGSHGLLISIKEPAGLPSNIKWQKILPMDYRQYSLFVMFALHNFIDSDYCLIVQHDGWVINGKNWSEEFFKYDYIGAPCHAAFIGNELIHSYQWVGNSEAVVIQNGGFSLRSKKYLEAPSHFGALYYFSDVSVLQNEDVQLTGIFKKILVDNGIKFAPQLIAKNFSLEYAGPNYHDDVSFKNLVGIHGQTRHLVSEDTIRITIPKNEVVNIHREEELLSYLKIELGYKIEFA
jgi:hypothetical protein